MTVGIIVTTYFPEGEIGKRRMEYAKVAFTSWVDNLRLSEETHFHVADDGSSAEWIEPFKEFVEGSFSQQQRLGVGASLNAGIQEIKLRNIDVFGYFVDDWILNDGFYARSWVELLRNRNHIGVVRIGMPHPGITGRVEMEPEGWLLRLNRHNFAFGFRPALYHTRFFEAYGPFDEMQSSLECERMYNERFCKGQGPDIVLALPSPFTPTAQDIVLSDIQPMGY